MRLTHGGTDSFLVTRLPCIRCNLMLSTNTVRSCIQPFICHQSWWPWMTLDGVMAADARYLCGSWAFCAFGYVFHLCRSKSIFWPSFNEISWALAEILLPVSIQDAQLSQRLRCRVRYSFGKKWKTGTGRQYFTDIIGLSSTTVT